MKVLGFRADPSGPRYAIVGHSRTHEFRFEHQKATSGKFDVVAFKKSKATHRESRIGRVCSAGLTTQQSTQQIGRFVKGVVEGI
jgi:hypothetical protein